eukprot:scaffold114166_cov27-Tisochrysis_lutea.AAC.1
MSHNTRMRRHNRSDQSTISMMPDARKGRSGASYQKIVAIAGHFSRADGLIRLRRSTVGKSSATIKNMTIATRTTAQAMNRDA